MCEEVSEKGIKIFHDNYKYYKNYQFVNRFIFL
jgi:ABC-type Zn2+ transport system substrate-binding protein/surface adhesin